MGGDLSTGFDGWLSRQLRVALDRERGPRPRPGQARYQAAARNRRTKFVAIRSSIIAALGAKAAVGGAAVALAAGAAAGTVATGSVNPVNWGQKVVQQVEKCEQPTTGNRGECVSDFAKMHGKTVRAMHAESAESPAPGTHTTTPGAHNGEAASHANANSAVAEGHGQGTTTASHGTSDQAPANSHAQGRPTPGASPKS